MMMTCLGSDCAILILVKDSERLFEGGQVVRGQRFKDSFSVGLTKSGHNHLKVAQTWRLVQKTPQTKNSHNHLKKFKQHPKIVSAISKTTFFTNIGCSIQKFLQRVLSQFRINNNRTPF